jgi:hypothetical protein
MIKASKERSRTREEPEKVKGILVGAVSEQIDKRHIRGKAAEQALGCDPYYDRRVPIRFRRFLHFPHVFFV